MKRLVVGISGATGAIYGIRLLEFLSKSDVETHLVISDSAEKTIRMETSWTLKQVKALATVTYHMEDVGADISSGSFHTAGMVVIPCSIKSLSAIANSYNENLLIRAADVALKERRKLVLVVRETPLHRGHLSLMLNVADAGAVILTDFFEKELAQYDTGELDPLGQQIIALFRKGASVKDYENLIPMHF